MLYSASQYHSQFHISPIRLLEGLEHATFLYFSEGRKHYAGMLRESGLLPMLQHNAISPTGQPLCVYGDPAYPLRVHLQAPF